MPRSVFLFCLLAGCAAAPEPEPTHHLAVSYQRDDQFAKTPNTIAPTTAEHTPWRRLDVAAFAVTKAPESDPIEPAIAFIAASTGAPFRGASGITHGLRLLTPPRSAAWVASAVNAPATMAPVGAEVAVLAPSLITRITLGNLPMPDVMATLADSTLIVALAARPGAGGADELVKLSIGSLGDGETLVLFAPNPAPGRAGYVVALTPGPRLPDTVEQAAMALAEASEPHRAPFSLTLARQLEVAKNSVGERNRLGALLALVTRLDLPRCIDLLLAADEAVLVAITEALPEVDKPGGGEQAPWQIERAVWLATLPALQRGEASPALLACTRRQLGAAALDHTALQLLLETSAGPDAFAAGLFDENVLALDDQDAGTRMQAHGWLDARGQAIRGYDPLGDRAARREALRRAASTKPAGDGQ